MIHWSTPEERIDKLMGNTIRSSHCFKEETNFTVRRARKLWWNDPPQDWVAWLMLNPSHATGSADDDTTERLTRFARSWHKGRYDGWIAVNLYPFVEPTVPKLRERLRKELSGHHWKKDIATNLEDIEEISKMDVLRVLAFGSAAKDEVLISDCLKAFVSPKYLETEKLWCLGRTPRTKRPRHPARRGGVPIGTEPEIFNCVL